jgi:protein gp37
MEKRFKKGYEGRVFEHPERLSIPLKRRKDTVFAIWNDWCHESVGDAFRHAILSVATGCPQHIILALTKREKVLLAFANQAPDIWPENLWSGLTICNQPEADAKLLEFLQVPGKKFLSIEPMLGAVDLSEFSPFDIEPIEPEIQAQLREIWPNGLPENSMNAKMEREMKKHQIDAVILGGETGPGARPMHPDWVRSVRDQCAAARVPFFFKGWGDTPHLAWGPIRARDWKRRPAYRYLDGRTHDELPWVKEGLCKQ